MTLEAPMRCSALAEQLGEPLAGTVEQRRRWLLVEDRGAWGTDAVADLLGASAAAEAKGLGVRLLLVRRREGDPAADVIRRAILVDTEDRRMAIGTVSDVADLRIAELASQPIEDFGTPTEGPIFLVCTNGKRDACCALRGRAVVAALADAHAERVWECTHLGGHRFAGNLVFLPDGVVYGRVGPEDAPRLADAYLAGSLDPAHLRGRSAWPAPAQAAEVELRVRLGLRGVDDVRLLESRLSDGVADVALAGPDGASHRLRLVSEAAQPPRPTSCRADEVESPRHWRLVGAG